MRHPTVSVITASLNALPGLKRTTASLRSQSFDVVEHIVIDGGSTDGTPEWLDRQGDEMIWISESDLGIADALNKGVRRASGEWILVLHAEDTFVDESALEQAVAHLDTQSQIVSFNVLFITETGNRLWRSLGFSPKINFKTTIPHQGAFCRRDLFDRIGLFDPAFRIEMDYELFLRAYREGVAVDVIDTTIARMPNTGISSRLDWPSLRSRFAEERRIHQKHASGRALRAAYALYWWLYPTYRRLWGKTVTGA